MAVLPQTHSTIPSPSIPKSCQPVIDLTDDDLLEATTPSEHSQTNGAISNGAVLRCLYCQKGFQQVEHFETHTQTCAMRPPPLLKVPSPIGCKESDPPVISPKHRKRWCQKPVHPDMQPRFPMSEFSEYLGLAPKGVAEELLKEDKSHEIECTILDLDEEEPTSSNAAATPPRSSKRLLPQLSRDLSPPPVPVKSPRIKSVQEESRKIEKKQIIQVVEDIEVDDEESDKDTDSDSESSCSSKPEWIPEWVRDQMRTRSAASLLTIDFASPLGQRIKDKYSYKRPKPVDHQDTDDDIDGYEKFCHTPKKNTRFLDRLRNREIEYMVTFNRRKRIPDYDCHYIKFTRKDREEFLMVLKTGLTARARKLKKKLKPCSVKVKRVTEEEIMKWRPKPKPFQRRQFQNTASLSNAYPLANYPHLVPAHVQMQQRMLMQQQRQLQQHQQRKGLVASQCYLSTSPAGGVVPVHLTKNMFSPQPNGMLNGHFNINRQNNAGDENDLICISSDDEDDSDIKITSAKAPSLGGQESLKKSTSQPGGIIRFKCHLCSVEINGQLGSTDFIAEHFGKRHDVHNIRLHQNVDVNGQTVVTIVQDIPKANNGVAPVNAAQDHVSHEKNQHANKTGVTSSSGDDDIICID